MTAWLQLHRWQYTHDLCSVCHDQSHVCSFNIPATRSTPASRHTGFENAASSKRLLLATRTLWGKLKERRTLVLQRRKMRKHPSPDSSSRSTAWNASAVSGSWGGADETGKGWRRSRLLRLQVASHAHLSSNASTSHPLPHAFTVNSLGTCTAQMWLLSPAQTPRSRLHRRGQRPTRRPCLEQRACSLTIDMRKQHL